MSSTDLLADEASSPPKKQSKSNGPTSAEPDTLDSRDAPFSEGHQRKHCGVIMPISAMPEYSVDHWQDVLAILKDAIENAGFHSDLVSEGEEVGIIQKRIIQNLYENEIVVCDVSGRNANVMFELGMRLAFDKPTVIVKDNTTPYPFDTSAIEYIEYPRDQRFQKIVEFKERLTKKIIATHEMATKDSNYSTFLKSFGEYQVAKLQKTEVSQEEYVIKRLDEIMQRLDQIPQGGLRLPLSKRRIRPDADFEEVYSIRQYEKALSVLEAAMTIAKVFLSNVSKDAFSTRQDLYHATMSAIFQDAVQIEKFAGDNAYRELLKRSIYDLVDSSWPGT